MQIDSEPIEAEAIADLLCEEAASSLLTLCSDLARPSYLFSTTHVELVEHKLVQWRLTERTESLMGRPLHRLAQLSWQVTDLGRAVNAILAKRRLARRLEEAKSALAGC